MSGTRAIYRQQPAPSLHPAEMRPEIFDDDVRIASQGAHIPTQDGLGTAVLDSSCSTVYLWVGYSAAARHSARSRDTEIAGRESIGLEIGRGGGGRGA